MSYDPDFEKRINNKIETIVENQARFDERMRVMQEAITSLIQVARLHNEQLDHVRERIAENEQQLTETRLLIVENERQFAETRLLIAENARQIAELREQGREQDERLNTLIRIVEAHVSNHP